MRETMRGYLIFKGIDANYHKWIWLLHGEPTMSNDYGDDDIVDDASNNENYRLFDDEMQGMIGDAFECHKSNDGSSRLNNEQWSSLN